MKYYKSCETLPLKNFFKIIEENNFKYLVISDDYDFDLKTDLSELWGKITIEFVELGGDKEILSGFNAYKEIHQLIYTYEILQAMIFSLHYRYNQQYIEDLAMFGYNVQITNNIIVLASLKECAQRSRAILNDIDEIKNGLPKDVSKSKNSFYEVLAWLIKGYGNLEENISVAKFIGLKTLLNSTIKKENGRNQR